MRECLLAFRTFTSRLLFSADLVGIGFAMSVTGFLGAIGFVPRFIARFGGHAFGGGAGVVGHKRQ